MGLLGWGWVGSWWVVLVFGGTGAGLGVIDVIDALAVCDYWGYMGAEIWVGFIILQMSFLH